MKKISSSRKSGFITIQYRFIRSLLAHSDMAIQFLKKRYLLKSKTSLLDFAIAASPARISRFKAIALIMSLICCVLLTSCGQYGPLYLPEQPQAEKQK